MKASYNWLKDFVDFDLEPKDLAHSLTMAGFEVEEIEDIEDDVVFDIGVTPNRPDCLSIRGLAREISTILDIPLKDISVSVVDGSGGGPSVEIKDSDLCFRYSSRIIKGVKPAASPEWLVKRLESCGVRSTSNIVDITNYVLLEFGQPLHAFDLDMLSGEKIIVGRAGDIKSFVTLDDEERSINKDTLLINDSEKPVALAGVMGGQNTEVTDSTVNILLESACFKPSSVRRTSKALNLSTESSFRFERGIDIETVPLALDRAAEMIKKLAGGKISKMTDEYPSRFTPTTIKVSIDRICSLIGIDIDHTFIEKTLASLGFGIEREGEVLNLTPPSYREDIKMDVDIIEEVARLYGYDRIPSTLPVIHMTASPVHRTQELMNCLKDSIVKSGYSESINYSFISPDLLDKLNLPSDDIRKDLIYIRNPLRQEESAMRTTLLPSLLNNINLNLSRGEKMLRLFEISRVFISSGEKLPTERLQASIIFHKDRDLNLWIGKHEGFYDIKGVIENIFNYLKLPDVEFIQDDSAPEPYLHPGKSCSVTVASEKIGSIGELHPGVASAYDINGDIAVAEIYDLERLVDFLSKERVFTQIPKFPHVERDIAVIVDASVPVSIVREEIIGIGSEMIESVNLFDIYRGKPIPKNKKSLAFSVRYRSSAKTLTDDEVDQVHREIIKRLESGLGAELR